MIGGITKMEIRIYDRINDEEKIRKLQECEDEYTKKLKKAMDSDEDIYIADCNGIIVGFLLIQRFNKIRVTPTVYVIDDYRRRGIGTQLIQYSDKIIVDSIYEHAICEYVADDAIAEFLKRNGFSHFYSEVLMERDNSLIDSELVTDKALLNKGIKIRNYQDKDYWGWHSIEDVAFYLMRQEIGLKPQFYYPPSLSKRKSLAQNNKNRYVMTVNGEVVAACRVDKNDIALLGVRPDQQSKGYGRMMIAYLNNKFITEHNASKVTIGVIEGNPAKRLYDRLGFRKVGYLYDYIKFYRSDSRQKAPKGYISTTDILNELRIHGVLKEEMIP